MCLQEWKSKKVFHFWGISLRHLHLHDLKKICTILVFEPLLYCNGIQKPVLIITVDRGPDWNSRYAKTTARLKICSVFTIDPESEKNNFAHAGKIPTEIWSHAVIDGNSIHSELTFQPASQEILKKIEEWMCQHVPQGQYCLQIVKCGK